MPEVGQLFCVGFHGVRPPAELLAAIREERISGVILFTRNLQDRAQSVSLVAELQAAVPSGLPLLVAIDQEGGTVQRLRTTDWPSHEELGRGSPERTRATAHAIGEEIAAIGCNVNFSPVLDVLLEPRNPVMAGRCFAAEAHRVAEHGAAFIRGLRDAGMAACGKHFPGHGRTTRDSHVELPEVNVPRHELVAHDTVPFERAIAEGVDLIMTAHVRYPALDAQWPATLSRTIVTDLLRNQLRFRGVVVTDALEMKALAQLGSREQVALQAVEAGCDLLLIGECEDYGASCRDALSRACQDNAFLRARMTESAARVLALRQKLSTTSKERFSQE